MISGKELIFTFLCLNLSVYMLNGMGVIGISGYPKGFFLPTDVGGMFMIENWNISLGTLAIAGGILVGLIAALMGHAIWGVAGVIIWVLSVLFRPIGLVVTGFPTFISSIALMMGADNAIVIMLNGIVGAVVVVVMFFFFIEIAAARPLE